MKTGIELIAAERQEQIEKHGFDQLHDSENDSKQLRKAATYLLTGVKDYIPEWEYKWYLKLSSKIYKAMSSKEGEIELLKVAGALIAAEIDRLQNEI
jgi:hypothetical protein